MTEPMNVVELAHRQELEVFKAQLTQVTCEKIALDNAFGEQLRITHNVRTQLAFTAAERDKVIHDFTQADEQNKKYLADIEALQTKLASAEKTLAEKDRIEKENAEAIMGQKQELAA